MGTQIIRGDVAVQGASTSITYLTATSLTLTEAHETVTVNSATAVAITVPTGVLGKSYRIKNCGAGLITLTGTAQNFFDFQSQTTIVLAKGDTTAIQWDGNFWVIWY